MAGTWTSLRMRDSRRCSGTGETRTCCGSSSTWCCREGERWSRLSFQRRRFRDSRRSTAASGWIWGAATKTGQHSLWRCRSTGRLTCSRGAWAMRQRPMMRKWFWRKARMTSIRCILWVFLPMIFIIPAPGGRIRTFLTTPFSSGARMSCFVRQFRLPLWNWSVSASLLTTATVCSTSGAMCSSTSVILTAGPTVLVRGCSSASSRRARLHVSTGTRNFHTNGKWLRNVIGGR